MTFCGGKLSDQT